MSGRSRLVCVLTIPLLPDIKGKLSVLCKRWWRQKPVVYVGGGAITAGCHQQLKETVEALNLPVVSSLMGTGAFPATHRQALGMLGMHGTYEANMTMHNADVIFAVGVRFDDRTTNNLAKYCPNATVLHIDIDPTSISKTVTADIPIVGMLASPRTNA